MTDIFLTPRVWSCHGRLEFDWSVSQRVFHFAKNTDSMGSMKQQQASPTVLQSGTESACAASTGDWYRQLQLITYTVRNGLGFTCYLPVFR